MSNISRRNPFDASVVGAQSSEAEFNPRRARLELFPTPPEDQGASSRLLLATEFLAGPVNRVQEVGENLLIPKETMGRSLEIDREKLNQEILQIVKDSEKFSSKDNFTAILSTLTILSADGSCEDCELALTALRAICSTNSFRALESMLKEVCPI